MSAPAPGPSAFTLDTSFVHLGHDGAATVVPTGPDFWQAMPPIFSTGSMVSILPHARDWPNWEKHPAGDELIHCLSGRITLLLEDAPGALRRVALAPGQATIVPAGIWHTAEVAEAGSALFVTPGVGTDHRAR